MKKNQFGYTLTDYELFIHKVLFMMPMHITQKYEEGIGRESTKITNDDKIKETLIFKCKNQIDNAIIDFLEQWEINFDSEIITQEKTDKI